MLVKEESMDANDILRKYAAKIESQISTERNVSFSKEYAEFKEESMPHLSRFESLCKNTGRTFKIRQNDKESAKVKRNLEIAHLDVEPEEVMGLAVLMMIISLFASLLIIVGIYLATYTFSFMAVFLMLLFSTFILKIS